MASFDAIEAALRASMKIYDNLPSSARIMSMIEQANQIVSRVLIPYETISRQLEVVQRAMGPHLEYLSQIDRIASSYQQMIPSVTRQLQLSTAVFESLRRAEFVVPQYLSSFGHDYEALQ